MIKIEEGNTLWIQVNAIELKGSALARANQNTTATMATKNVFAMNRIEETE